jgi:RimJ/RimL family protein N-acetyltransferase
VRLRNGRTLEVRAATPEDAEPLLALVRSVAAEEVYIKTEKVDRSPEQEREWIRGFDGRSSLLVVAVLDGVIVGSADFARGRPSKSAHVVELGLAVQSEARGLGIGRALLETGTAWARSVGARKLHLQVFRSNERAIGLYRSLGFEEEGRLKDHVVLRGRPDDLLLLSVWLDPFPSPGARTAHDAGAPARTTSAPGRSGTGAARARPKGRSGRSGPPG